MLHKRKFFTLFLCTHERVIDTKLLNFKKEKKIIKHLFRIEQLKMFIRVNHKCATNMRMNLYVFESFVNRKIFFSVYFKLFQKVCGFFFLLSPCYSHQLN